MGNTNYELNNDKYVDSSVVICDGGKSLDETIQEVKNSALSGIDNIARQETSEEINDKIDLVRQEIKGVDLNLTSSISGSSSSFGTGVLGDVTYSEDFIYPAKDYYGRYILLCKNFTLPEGVTMTPPSKCNGLYIYCQESCNINGTIDMRGQRLTLTSDNGISNYITIGEKNYLLAVGGDTVKGGDGGYSGKSDGNGYVYATGGVAGNPTAGNVNGGGSNNYGFAGKAENDGNKVGLWTTGDARAYDASFTTTLAEFSSLSELRNSPIYGAKNGGVSEYRPSAGAVVIAAPTVNITGTINCEGTEGVACINQATSAAVDEWSYGNTGAHIRKGLWNCGKGTDGSQAPTGGGCITILTKAFNNTGSLLTKGQSLTALSTAVGSNALDSDSDDGSTRSIYCTGGKAGGGGTFISQAGQIKIHIITE